MGRQGRRRSEMVSGWTVGVDEAAGLGNEAAGRTADGAGRTVGGNAVIADQPGGWWHEPRPMVWGVYRSKSGSKDREARVDRYSVSWSVD